MWITLTEQHVADRLSAAELTAYTGRFRAGSDSPLPGIITGVVREVRGYVAGYRSNSLQAGETIPEELTDAACALIVARLISRLPVALSDDRKDARKDALTLLAKVSTGAFFVSAPAADVLADSQPESQVELASGEGAYPGSKSLSGLF